MALKLALANFLFTPEQVQHCPTMLVALILVHDAVQAPVVVEPSGFRP